MHPYTRYIFAQMREKIWNIILIGLAVSVCSGLFLIFSQSPYRADTAFLITFKNSTETDYYTVSRSAEYVGKALSEVVVSERFLDTAIAAGFVNPSSFSPDKKERLKQWTKMVSVSRGADFGFLNVRVFGDTNPSTQRTAKAVAEILTTKTKDFLGDTANVEMKILSGPIVERNPSFTELVLAALGGFILGAALSVFLLLFRLSGTYREPDRELSYR